MKMMDEVLLNLGAQDMGTSGYQVSVLDDFDFYPENDQLDVNVVLRPRNETPFSSIALDDLEMGGLAENPILLDEEEDKENSPPATLVSVRSTQPPALLRMWPFGTMVETVPEDVFRKLFHSCVCVF